MKHVLIFAAIISMATLLLSCSLRSQTDISNTPEYEKVAYQTFTLERDVFLIYYRDSKTYSLEAPGFCSTIPSSVDEFLADPSLWQHHFDTVQGVIAKGTKLFVKKIFIDKGFESQITRFIVQINDPRYFNLNVNILFLMDRKNGESFYFPNPKYLTYVTG